MFSYIFDCYKEDIHNRPLIDAVKKMARNEVIAFVVLLILLFSALFMLKINVEWSIILMVLLLMFSPIFTAYMNKQWRKKRHTKKAEYLSNRISPLFDKLEENKLDNIKGIDFLIEQCDNILKNDNDNSSTYKTVQPFLPFITLVLGALLSRLELEKIYIMIAGIIMLALTVFTYAQVKEAFLGEEKRLAKELKIDLKYISTMLPID